MKIDGYEVLGLLLGLVLAIWIFAPLWNKTVGTSVAFLAA